MKRKKFLPIIKYAAFLMMIAMLLSMATGSAYANDIDQENGEIVEEIEPDQILGLLPPENEDLENEEDIFDDSSVEPRPGGKYFMTGLAVLSGGFGTTGSHFGKGYTCVYKNDGYKGYGVYADLNNNAGGKNVFLGYTCATSIYGEDNKLRSDLITGLVVYNTNGKNPPKQLEYKGKTYKPITTFFGDAGASNGDLNQGAGGDYRFLYYTNDGIENGDPVLTWIRARYPSGKSHSAKYVKIYTADDVEDTKEHCYCQDINAGIGGDYIYLETDYHTHTYVTATDESGHAISICTGGCHFHKKKHNYKYTNLTDKPDYHEATCIYEGCTERFVESHVDADGDGSCDKCHARGVALVDDVLFESFNDAWEYAVDREYAVTLYIFESADAGKGRLLPVVNNGADITIKRASSADPSSAINVYDEQAFIITDGSLSIETDIVVKSENLKYLASVTGADSLLRIANATIDVQSPKAKPNCAVICVENGASVTVNDGTIIIEEKELKATGINIEEKDSSAKLTNLTIQGAEHAIKAAQSENVTIENGEFNGETCALLLTKGARATVKGGKFIGAECINATDGNVTIDNIKVRGEFKSPSTVAELLPKNYGAFILDASEELYEGLAYRDLKVANYMFDKLVWIGGCNGHAILKVQSISDKEHEGHCEYCNMAVVLPHEFGEGGTCIICGGGAAQVGPDSDNPETGDNLAGNIIWYVIMFGAAAVVISGVLLYLKKKIK